MIRYMLETNTINNLLVFTKRGQYYMPARASNSRI